MTSAEVADEKKGWLLQTSKVLHEYECRKASESLKMSLPPVQVPVQHGAATGPQTLLRCSECEDPPVIQIRVRA